MTSQRGRATLGLSSLNLAAAFGALAIASVLLIPESCIDHRAAWSAQVLGYHAAFFLLGSVALVSVGLWLSFAGTLRAACAGAGERRPDPARGGLR
jgi:hypothetical protein